MFFSPYRLPPGHSTTLPEVVGHESETIGATQEDECTQFVTESNDHTRLEQEESGSVQEPWGRLIPLERGAAHIQLFPRPPSTVNGPLNMYVMGRGRTCDIRLDDARVSSQHCRILCLESKEGGRALIKAYVEDTSTNGTFINRRIRLVKGQRRVLNSGDEISLCRTKSSSAYDATSYVFTLVESNQAIRRPGVFSPLHPTSAPSLMSSRRSGSACGRRVEDFYDIREEIGRGTSGTVHIAVHRKSGEAWAVKVIETKRFSLTPGLSPKELVQEAEMLRTINHPNVVRLHDIFQAENAIYLVMELVRGGDLFDRIVDKGRYPEATAREIMFRVLKAVQYLHAQGIVHRDLKPENILLVSKESDVDCKITDFGLAKRASKEGLKTFCGTPQYFAPEVLKRRNTKLGTGRYGQEADMWSLGVILYILLSGTPPFDDTTLFEQIRTASYTLDGEEWEGVSDVAKDLVRRLMTASPVQRLKADQAVFHAWFARQSSVATPAPWRSPDGPTGDEVSPPTVETPASDGKRARALHSAELPPLPPHGSGRKQTMHQRKSQHPRPLALQQLPGGTRGARGKKDEAPAAGGVSGGGGGGGGGGGTKRKRRNNQQPGRSGDGLERAPCELDDDQIGEYSEEEEGEKRGKARVKGSSKMAATTGRYSPKGRHAQAAGHDRSPLAAMFPPPPRIPCTASTSAATPSTEPPARITLMAPPQPHHRSSSPSQSLSTTTGVEGDTPHTGHAAKATDASAARKRKLDGIASDVKDGSSRSAESPPSMATPETPEGIILAAPDVPAPSATHQASAVGSTDTGARGDGTSARATEAAMATATVAPDANLREEDTCGAAAGSKPAKTTEQAQRRDDKAPPPQAPPAAPNGKLAKGGRKRTAIVAGVTGVGAAVEKSGGGKNGKGQDGHAVGKNQRTLTSWFRGQRKD